MEIPVIYKKEDKVEHSPETRQLIDNYLRHTTVGDPVLDAVMEEVGPISPKDLSRFIKAGVEEQKQLLKQAPGPLREFFENYEEPDWLDFKSFEAGIQSFSANVDLMLAAFVTGVLIEGFSTTIAKSFYITGRVKGTNRRLKQNNRHLMEIFFPEGLKRGGDGRKLSIRIRFVHARIRYLLAKSDKWDAGAWGTPLSAANLGLAISTFSMRLLKYAKILGADFSEEEEKGVLAVWRYAGHLMGIPEIILYKDGPEAEEIYRIAHLCEPEPGDESVAMANALIQAIPSVVGATDAKERKKLIGLAYRLSTGLIGQEAAEKFHYPSISKLNTVFTRHSFRLQQRTHRLLKNQQFIKFENFSALLKMSIYDEGGISYRMPDHVDSYLSSSW